MTRKKYIKQLMALGISKNEANGKALLCQLYRCPYAESLRIIKKFHNLDEAIQRAKDAFTAAGPAIAAAAQAIKEAIRANTFIAGGVPHD